jgi:excisionase family DNA binding protein
MNRKNQLLDIKETAERLGISVFTLRGWVSQRRVQFVKMGRRVFFRDDYIDRLIEECTKEPSSHRGAS